MALATTWLLAVSLVGCAHAASHPWEWAGTFDLAAGHYTISFTKQEVTGYADPSIQILILKTDGTSKEELENVENAAIAAWGSPTEKSSYEELEVGTSYTLMMNDHTWTTHFIIHVDAHPGAHAIFMQHVPYEFENGFHYLKTEGGKDVEHVYEENVGGHGHGGHGGAEAEEVEQVSECPWSKDWEWSAIFEVSSGAQTLDWNAEKGTNGYLDPSMIIAVYTTSEENFTAALENTAHNDWDSSESSKTVVSGGTIPLNTARTLVFDQMTWASHFKIALPAGHGGHIAVFAQHFPVEFETNYHYLKYADASDIEPKVEKSLNGCPAAEEETKKTTTDDLWGEVIGASFLTVLPTLLSIMFIAVTLAPKIVQMSNDGSGWLGVIHNFASGVIFAAAVFLLLPEGLYLSSTLAETEAGGNGAWGSAVMGGWLFCVIIKHLGQIIGAKSADEGATGMNWPVCVPILFGDCFHNLADGLVIGTAFKTCTSSFGWKLTGVTVLHEIPQEISDFAVLITNGRMGPIKATLGNFISGLSTVLGAIITYSIEVDQGVEGVILAAGGGVYMFVAMTELGPMVTDLAREGVAIDSIKRLLGFTIGAIILGLILLDHEHCGGVHLLSYDPDAAAADGGEGEGGGGGGHHH